MRIIRPNDADPAGEGVPEPQRPAPPRAPDIPSPNRAAAPAPAPAVIPIAVTPPPPAVDPVSHVQAEMESLDAKFRARLEQRLATFQQQMESLLQEKMAPSAPAAAPAAAEQDVRLNDWLQESGQRLQTLQQALEKQLLDLKQAVADRDQAFTRLADDLHKTQQAVDTIRDDMRPAEVPPAMAPTPPPPVPPSAIIEPPPATPAFDDTPAPAYEPEAPVELDSEPEPSPMPAFALPDPRPVGFWQRLKRYLNGTVVELPTHSKRGDR